MEFCYKTDRSKGPCPSSPRSNERGRERERESHIEPIPKYNIQKQSMNAADTSALIPATFWLNKYDSGYLLWLYLRSCFSDVALKKLYSGGRRRRRVCAEGGLNRFRNCRVLKISSSRLRLCSGGAFGHV